jgi:hypothetical protein
MGSACCTLISGRSSAKLYTTVTTRAVTPRAADAQFSPRSPVLSSIPNRTCLVDEESHIWPGNWHDPENSATFSKQGGDTFVIRLNVTSTGSLLGLSSCARDPQVALIASTSIDKELVRLLQTSTAFSLSTFKAWCDSSAAFAAVLERKRSRKVPLAFAFAVKIGEKLFIANFGGIRVFFYSDGEVKHLGPVQFNLFSVLHDTLVDTSEISVLPPEYPIFHEFSFEANNPRKPCDDAMLAMLTDPSITEQGLALILRETPKLNSAAQKICAGAGSAVLVKLNAAARDNNCFSVYEDKWRLTVAGIVLCTRGDSRDVVQVFRDRFPAEVVQRYEKCKNCEDASVRGYAAAKPSVEGAFIACEELVRGKQYYELSVLVVVVTRARILFCQAGRVQARCGARIVCKDSTSRKVLMKPARPGSPMTLRKGSETPLSFHAVIPGVPDSKEKGIPRDDKLKGSCLVIGTDAFWRVWDASRHEGLKEFYESITRLPSEELTMVLRRICNPNGKDSEMGQCIALSFV